MYQAEHGERLKPNMISKHELKKSIIKYFSVLRDCGYGDTDTEKPCLRIYENKDENAKAFYKTYNNQTMRQTLLDDGQFVLKDGSSIFLENSENIILISVDVNGYLKKPNRWGHDLFTFQLMDDGKILPNGAPNTYYGSKDNNCSTQSNHTFNGIACTYYALNDKDYFNNLPR